MRVTNKMLSNSFLSDMRNNLENMRKLQQQMTSGKEIRRPSDDPFKVARAMQLHTDINTNKQYNENISDTINWLDTTDTALGQIGDVLQRVRELLVSAGNGGYSENERLAIKDEINEKVGEISQILNTNFDGAYIFGGTRATTKPVEVIGGANYENALKVKVTDFSKWQNKDITIEVGGTPKTITIPTGINNLNDLAKSINNSLNTPTDMKIKVIPNISENSILFINSNNTPDPGTNANIILPTTVGDITVPTEIKPTPVNSSNENTKLIYYNKLGGELDSLDSTHKDQLNQINSKLKVQISQGVVMDYNVTATEVLQFRTAAGKELDLREIFAAITNHLDGKDSNGTAVDADSVKNLINDDLQNMTDAISNLLKIRSEVGAKQNRMDSAQEKNIDATFNMTEILSKTEDIDITEKTMEYATMQTIYLASLQTSAKVLQPSLIDYL